MGQVHPRPLEWSTTRTARSEERPRSGRGERVMLTSAAPGRHRGVLQRCAVGWSNQPKSGSRRAVSRAGSWSDRRPRQPTYRPRPAGAAPLAKLADAALCGLPVRDRSRGWPTSRRLTNRQLHTRPHETELGSAAEFLSCGRAKVVAGPLSAPLATLTPHPDANRPRCGVTTMTEGYAPGGQASFDAPGLPPIERPATPSLTGAQPRHRVPPSSIACGGSRSW
jgi:hypothetical protein